MNLAGCCCSNCAVKILTARADRIGHKVLYVTSGSTGSSLTYRVKSIDYTEDGYDYHSTVTIIEDKTGKLTIDETSSLPGGSTLDDNRSRAWSAINFLFDSNKTNASGTYGTVTWNRGLDGVDVISASYSDSSGTHIVWSIGMSDEYTDAQFIAMVDDLRRNYDAGGGGTGIASADEITQTILDWNQVDDITMGLLNAYPFPDPSTYSSMTSLADPAVVISHFTPAEHVASHGSWWQHYGDPYDTGYTCIYYEDTTMPNIAVVESGNLNTLQLGVVRFNTPHNVCGSAEMLDNGSSTDPMCVEANSIGGFADWYSPDPIPVDHHTLTYPTGYVTFSSPSELTGSDCPCTSAP
jgi:hypothetical protein